MGAYTIVTDYLANSPAKKVADESWMLDVKNVEFARNESSNGDILIEKYMEAGLAKCFHTVEAFMNNESLAHGRKRFDSVGRASGLMIEISSGKNKRKKQ